MINMIDFHSHILPGIDDGAQDIKQSITILEEAKNAGFSKIILTPHYIEQYYEYDENKRKQLVKELEQYTKEVKLYLGNEIYITNNIAELIKDKKASSISGTKYVLFEFPLTEIKPLNDKEVIYRLIENGYVPIIAHPERYPFIQKNPDYLFELSDMGALFQANFGSIIGMYGSKSKKTLKTLLKNDLISFFGTDTHRPGHVYPKMPQILRKLKKLLSDEDLERLTNINPQKVLYNEDIEY